MVFFWSSAGRYDMKLRTSNRLLRFDIRFDLIRFGSVRLGWFRSPPTQEEEENRRDYDMHRLAREERLKGKKLRGKRRRKEAEREKAPGQGFRVDVADERFAALLEGDTRFGIDRTDSSFKVGCVVCDGLGRASIRVAVSFAVRQRTEPREVLMFKAQMFRTSILPKGVKLSNSTMSAGNGCFYLLDVCGPTAVADLPPAGQRCFVSRAKVSRDLA